MVIVEFFNENNYSELAPHHKDKMSHKTSVCIVESYLGQPSIKYAVAKTCKKNEKLLLALAPAFPHALDFVVHQMGPEKQKNFHVCVEVKDEKFVFSSMEIEELPHGQYAEYVAGFKSRLPSA